MDYLALSAHKTKQKNTACPTAMLSVGNYFFWLVKLIINFFITPIKVG
jgi:hypothetical protein